jgi:hypothetical protein
MYKTRDDRNVQICFRNCVLPPRNFTNMFNDYKNWSVIQDVTFKTKPEVLYRNTSSSARQPYVGPGLPQKLLPPEVSGYCFFTFRDESFFRVGWSALRLTPGYPEGPMFSVRVISLSRLVPVLKRQDLAFCPCMT